MHKHRTWVVSHFHEPEEVAHQLAEHTWCACKAFGLADYVLLNDSTGPDGAQEYAIVKRIPQGDGTFAYRQIESITASWMSEERIVEFLTRMIAGEIDDVEWAFDVTPTLETKEQHGRCHLCA